jgi:hypothetical protein
LRTRSIAPNEGFGVFHAPKSAFKRPAILPAHYRFEWLRLARRGYDPAGGTTHVPAFFLFSVHIAVFGVGFFLRRSKDREGSPLRGFAFGHGATSGLTCRHARRHGKIDVFIR